MNGQGMVLTHPTSERRDWLRPWWVRAALLLGLWSIPGVIYISQVIFVWGPQMKEGPPSFAHAFLAFMPAWWFWAPMTPVVLWLSRRFPLERGRSGTSIPVHLLAMGAVTLGAVTVSIVSQILAGKRYSSPLSEWFWMAYMKNLHMEAFMYCGVLAAGQAADYYRRFRERSLVAAQLETKLAQAQLDALKAQLQPHFLFNTLHAIAVLVRKQDTQGSVKMITGLSDLLRMALDTVGKQVVTLKQELDFVDRYLDIEKIRFQDRLQVERDIAPDLLDAEIPNLVLQPIVENAIRHGISARAAAGHLVLRVRRERDSLIVTVRDDGAGLHDGWKEGIGLSNVRARLAQLYGDRARLTLSADPGCGVVTTIEVPFRRE